MSSNDKNSHFYPECPKRTEKVIISFEIVRVSKFFMYQYLITSPCYNCGKNLSDWTIISVRFQSWKLWKIAFGTYMVLKNRDVHSKFLYALKVITQLCSKQYQNKCVVKTSPCFSIVHYFYNFHMIFDFRVVSESPNICEENEILKNINYLTLLVVYL